MPQPPLSIRLNQATNKIKKLEDELSYKSKEYSCLQTKFSNLKLEFSSVAHEFHETKLELSKKHFLVKELSYKIEINENSAENEEK